MFHEIVAFYIFTYYVGIGAKRVLTFNHSLRCGANYYALG